MVFEKKKQAEIEIFDPFENLATRIETCGYAFLISKKT